MFKHLQQRRSAFSLIELLAVIAIIAIVIAFLLPAIQRARETSARAACENNLKQIGAALHNYEGMHGHLPEAVQYPTNVWWDIANADDRTSGLFTYGFGPNWAVLILPQMEQSDLYATVNAGNYRASGGMDAGWRSLRNATVKSYLCPSDPHTGTECSQNGGDWARGNYGANAGPTPWGNQLLNGNSPASWEWGYYNPGGPVMGPNFGAVIAKIEDGSSNTIMVAEIRAGASAGDRRGTWAMGTPGASIIVGGGTGDCGGPNDGTDSKFPYCDHLQDGDDNPGEGLGASSGCNNRQAQARSQHAGGVNAVFSDGSVRFIHNSISKESWYKLLSRNDGQPAPNDF